MGFNPAQLATASMIGQIGGAATSAVGSYFSAATQKENLRGQAAMAEINARISEMGAQSALMQGQHETARLTLNAGQLKGRQRAALAASGVAMGEGSAREIQASADILKDIDKNTIMANAVSQAWGQRMQAVNYQNEALFARANAKGIKPFASAATSLLGSATQVASSWYQFKNTGAFDPQTKPVEGMSLYPASGRIYSDNLWSAADRPVSWS